MRPPFAEIFPCSRGKRYDDDDAGTIIFANVRGWMMKAMIASWPFWAVLSAGFAALTAIFGKVGVENVNSDFATLIRTVVILAVIALIVAASGAWQPPAEVPGRTWLFLGLSGLATGASWLCYYRALQLGPASGVAPIDKMSVVLVALFAVLFLGERLEMRNWLGIVMIAGGAVLVAARA
jgi:transporter family protein